MTDIATAKAHLDEALQLLSLEAYRVNMDGTQTPENNYCNIEVELDRVDRAIGPKGESMFGKLAQTALAVFIEIKAARAALEQSNA